MKSSPGGRVQATGAWVDDRTCGQQVHAAFPGADSPNLVDGMGRRLGFGMDKHDD